MPVFDPTLTAQKAAENLMATHPEVNLAAGTSTYIDATRTSNRRRKRIAPPELSIMDEYKKKLVHIFNVGPWRHEIPCGSAGTFIIPACPEGKEYIEMTTPLHEMESEEYPDTESTNKRLYEEGRKMALEILGHGQGRNRKDSLDHYGVFVAAGEVPTVEELHAANAMVDVKCQEYISQIRTLWETDRKVAHDTYNPRVHGVAAKRLGLKDEDWMLAKTPQRSAEAVPTAKCKGCRTEVEADAPKCFKCGAIVNKEAFIAFEQEQRAIAAEARANSKKGE